MNFYIVGATTTTLFGVFDLDFDLLLSLLFLLATYLIMSVLLPATSSTFATAFLASATANDASALAVALRNRLC
jgi:hypothetical protein